MSGDAARALATLLITAGCGDAIGPPPTQPLAGGYVASSIVRQQDGLNDDLTKQGATLRLVLASDSTLTGRFVLPANYRATGESAAIDQALGGRWSLDRNQIALHLDQPLLGNEPTLAAVAVGLVGTLIVPDPINGTLWLELLLVPESARPAVQREAERPPSSR
jgi:hypothetical protein